ncbi:MAG TPA: VCBS repeat-containing protein [Kofleriaceae bacterium]|nr:VCBS repeat-containing protein [Kofleriaceae bacterium]
MFGFAIVLGHHAARAALAWDDGAPASSLAFCGATGEWTDGSVSWAGYVIDPVAETPQLGQVTYVHAVAINTNCMPDEVAFELTLPPGAHFAISPATPVSCIASAGAVTLACAQQPTTGPNGGAEFGGGFLAGEGSVFEIQVPVVFDQISDSMPLIASTISTWGTTDATVGVTVPYQPPLPQNTHGADLALIGAYSAPGTLPVAFSDDHGEFTVTNYPVGDFAAWARAPGVQRVSGDFNHDGLTDYALVGGPGWNTIPVAMSQGNGRFTVTNSFVGSFGAWASTAHVTAIAGDFNRDGYTDIALVGGAGWTTIPVAFSTGNGNFQVTDIPAPDFGAGRRVRACARWPATSTATA